VCAVDESLSGRWTDIEDGGMGCVVGFFEIGAAAAVGQKSFGAFKKLY